MLKARVFSASRKFRLRILKVQQHASSKAKARFMNVTTYQRVTYDICSNPFIICPFLPVTNCNHHKSAQGKMNLAPCFSYAGRVDALLYAPCAANSYVVC